MSIQTTTTESVEFIIVGQDQGTGYTLWDIAPAPTNPGRRAAVLEELGVDAMDAFGSVHTEWAATPRAAVNRLLAAMRDQSGLDDYDLTADSQTENLGPEEPTPATAGEALRRALKAAGIDTDVDGEVADTWAIVDLPCGAEIWITDRITTRIGGLADEHKGWKAEFYSTGSDSSVRTDLYVSEDTDLAADTNAVVNAVFTAVHADHHETPLPLAPQTLDSIAAKVRPHLPDAAFLTLDAADGTLRAVLDENRRTIWYAPASPIGLPDPAISEVERLANLLLDPAGMERIPGHDDTSEITLPRP
ncbi:hypothetical protein GCM10010387_15780 [Streptomyces inusitatus]|uniref:Uncharacterized protein n=1 Tax=Streptomyces inusitatus TaxID=68221 RepID=A0A918PVD7_9ACTN|nr:hypothetical protein [Streptomyces inusitatus]GGZ23451.1 hypothetical protein GCM10010387_15780 [Streptomyces inusitatus]